MRKAHLVRAALFLCFFSTLAIPIASVEAGEIPLWTLSIPPSLKDKTLEDLMAMLKDERPLFRQAAVEELGRRKISSAVPQLQEMLQDQFGFVRLKAAAALLEFGDKSGLPVARDLLNSIAWQDRLNAAALLAANGDESGLPLARIEFQNANWAIRTAAMEALASSRNDDTAYSALESALRDSEPSVRLTAINLLAKRPSKRSVELLALRLSDPDRDTRMLIIGALGQTKLCDAIPPLIDALADMDRGVRHSAAIQLNIMTKENKPTVGALYPDRARVIQSKWRTWWEANKENCSATTKAK